MNPVSVEVKDRILTTAISDEDGTASLDLAMSVADRFGLKKKEAFAIAAEVGAAVADWREVATHAVSGRAISISFHRRLNTKT